MVPQVRPPPVAGPVERRQPVEEPLPVERRGGGRAHRSTSGRLPGPGPLGARVGEIRLVGGAGGTHQFTDQIIAPGDEREPVRTGRRAGELHGRRGVGGLHDPWETSGRRRPQRIARDRPLGTNPNDHQRVRERGEGVQDPLDRLPRRGTRTRWRSRPDPRAGRVRRGFPRAPGRSPPCAPRRRTAPVARATRSNRPGQRTRASAAGTAAGSRGRSIASRNRIAAATASAALRHWNPPRSGIARFGNSRPGSFRSND